MRQKIIPRGGLLLGWNLAIVVMTAIGCVVMLFFGSEDGILVAHGAENLKFFTVLSNLFEGLVSLILALRLWRIRRGRAAGIPHGLFLLKLIACVTVTVTFLVVALFFGPLYGYLILYEGANLWFHLVIPLLAILEFIFLDRFDELSFRETLLPVLAPLIYGLLYCLNLLANGVGTGPDTNDFYGFLLWGLPVGLCIFAGILLLVWAAGVLLRLGNRAGRKRNTERTGGK